MNSSTPDKEELRAQVEEIYLETRTSVGGYLRYLGLPQAAADEVLQEVYLGFYKELLKGKTIENRKAWLLRVAHNNGVKVRKRDRRFAPEEPDWSRVIHPDETPERELLNRERMQRVKEAVEKLSPQQRQCLYLRAEGLRYREIAETLRIRLSTVNEFLRRALARLAEALNED